MTEHTKDDVFECLVEHLSEETVRIIIDNAAVVTRAETAEFLDDILTRADISPYELQNLTGISRQVLEQAVSKKRAIPKTTVFALCIVFRMDEERALDVVSKCGFGLTNAPEDLIFKAFISERQYRLEDYAEAVRSLYASLEHEDKLPDFFKRQYTNCTV